MVTAEATEGLLYRTTGIGEASATSVMYPARTSGIIFFAKKWGMRRLAMSAPSSAALRTMSMVSFVLSNPIPAITPLPFARYLTTVRNT